MNYLDIYKSYVGILDRFYYYCLLNKINLKNEFNFYNLYIIYYIFYL